MLLIHADISPLCSLLVSAFCFISVNVYVCPEVEGIPSKKTKKKLEIGDPPPTPRPRKKNVKTYNCDVLLPFPVNFFTPYMHQHLKSRELIIFSLFDNGKVTDLQSFEEISHICATVNWQSCEGEIYSAVGGHTKL